jgi:hypothetical protein
MIVLGSTNSLWNVVKTTKDVNMSYLPKALIENDERIPEGAVPDRFAAFSDTKVKNILSKVVISDTVYNGKKKLKSID